MNLERTDSDNIGYGGGGPLTLVVMAAIFFVIIFIIAIIFLAFAFKERKEIPAEYYGNKSNFGELITGLIAAKSMDNGNCKNGEIDRFEIMQKIEHSDDRRQIENTQRDIAQQGQTFMQLGFGLSNQIKDNEKDNLKEFGELKKELGMLNMGLSQVLQNQNNEFVITSVINRLKCGAC